VEIVDRVFDIELRNSDTGICEFWVVEIDGESFDEAG
jgi:hypothetical protein